MKDVTLKREINKAAHAMAMANEPRAAQLLRELCRHLTKGGKTQEEVIASLHQWVAQGVAGFDILIGRDEC